MDLKNDTVRIYSEGRTPPEWPLAYRLKVPAPTPSNNTIKGMHFQAYRRLRQDWHLMVRAALGRAERVPVERCFLVVNRRCAGRGLDWDNAYGGLKPLLDCLVLPTLKNPDGLGLIVDDSPVHMPLAPLLRQAVAGSGAGSTEVLIYNIENAESL